MHPNLGVDFRQAKVSLTWRCHGLHSVQVRLLLFAATVGAIQSSDLLADMPLVTTAFQHFSCLPVRKPDWVVPAMSQGGRFYPSYQLNHALFLSFLFLLPFSYFFSSPLFLSLLSSSVGTTASTKTAPRIILRVLCDGMYPLFFNQMYFSFVSVGCNVLLLPLLTPLPRDAAYSS